MCLDSFSSIDIKFLSFQKLLSFFILYAVVYNNYASGTNKGNSQNPANPGNPGSQENPGTLASSNPHRFSHLDHCEVKVQKFYSFRPAKFNPYSLLSVEIF